MLALKAGNLPKKAPLNASWAWTRHLAESSSCEVQRRVPILVRAHVIRAGLKQRVHHIFVPCVVEEGKKPLLARVQGAG
jgi:hypothetical protein